jgi:hypothetical protein
MKKARVVGRGSIIRFPLFDLASAGLDFCDAYLRLASPDRQKVEAFLLNQAFLPVDVAKVDWRYNQFTPADRYCSGKWLRTISDDLADAWHIWALEIAKTRPSKRASRDAFPALVGRMVFLKSQEPSGADTTRDSVSLPRPFFRNTTVLCIP